MARRPLIIATAAYPPYSESCSSGSLLPTKICRHPGISAEFLGQILHLTKIPYTLKNFLDPDWGYEVNGSWTGLLQMLLNGSLDAIAMEFIDTEQRKKAFAFSYPTGNTEMYFVVRRDSESFNESSKMLFQMADAMEMMILSILSPALHCDWWIPSWQQALITTVVFFGMLSSSAMWGNITDKYGRKNGICLATALTFYFGLLSASAPNYIWLLVLRGLVGFGIGGLPQTVTLYAEFLPSLYRAKCIVLLEMFWAFGAAFEVLLALFVMPTLGWRWLLFFSSLPLLLFLFCSYWMPESARYHIACGRSDLALASLQRVAQDNGKPMLEGVLMQPDAGSKELKQGRVVDLFVPELRRTTLLLWFIWLACAFSYYGIVLFTTELYGSGDECHGGESGSIHPVHSLCPLECHQLDRKDYMDLLWTCFAEFPGLIITVAIIDLIGRKKTIAMEFGIYSCTIFVLFACLNRIWLTVTIFIARMFVSGVFQAVYAYTPEVYPTVTRATGLGTCSMFARLGALLTPFVAQVVAGFSVNVSVGIYVGTCLVALVASLLLPIETKGRSMKDMHA